MIMVTAATGEFGRLVVDQLLERCCVDVRGVSDVRKVMDLVGAVFRCGTVTMGSLISASLRFRCVVSDLVAVHSAAPI